MKETASAPPLHTDLASHKEGPTMIDRERLLADEHQARLHEEAQARRLAAQATAARTGRANHALAVRARLALGQWLIGSGRRLDAGSEPYAPAEARPA